MKIYLVAGPPGVGKSTNEKMFVPFGIPIIDQDLAAYQYKQRGFADYRDIASLITNERIRQLIFKTEDFALELNLGFPSHYSFLRSIAAINPDIRIELILFYSDNINLCLDRAKVRHLSGGHEVTSQIIQEMYHATIPLLLENKALFQRVRFVDVSHKLTTELSLYSNDLPAWVQNNDLKGFLQS